MTELSELIALDNITVLPFVTRPASKVDDARDRRSIAQNGVQQPLVLVDDEEGRLLLADGLRRLRIARELGLLKVPCIIRRAPEGEDAEQHTRELRLVLDMHRQDLVPSQKCEFIITLRDRFKLSNKQVASALGCDQDSVTNWLAVRNYIPPVVAAMDKGKLTMQAARAFDGLNEEGQQMLWDKHGEMLQTSPGGKAHKQLRAMYPPTTHAHIYRNPDKTAQRLARVKKKRTSKPNVDEQEKRRLATSLDLKEFERDELVTEAKKLNNLNMAAAPTISAILRTPKLRAFASEEMLEELKGFEERYAA